MKRIGLFLLAVVMAVGLAGCPGSDPDVNVTGRWDKASDISCDGNPIYSVYRVYSDGTIKTFWQSGEASEAGTYSVDGRKVTIRLDVGYGGVVTTEYTANADGTEMSARYYKVGFEWCQSAVLTSRDPYAP